MGNKKMIFSKMLIPLVMLGIGLFLTIWPKNSLLLIVYLLALTILLMGVFKLWNYYSSAKNFDDKVELMEAIVFGLASVMMMVFANDLIKLITIIFGIYVLFEAIMTLFKVKTLKAYGLESWKYILVFGISLGLVGTLFIFKSFKAAEMIIRIMGVILMMMAIKDLYLEYCFSKIMSIDDNLL